MRELPVRACRASLRRRSSGSLEAQRQQQDRDSRDWRTEYLPQREPAASNAAATSGQTTAGIVIHDAGRKPVHAVPAQRCRRRRPTVRAVPAQALCRCDRRAERKHICGWWRLPINGPLMPAGRADTTNGLIRHAVGQPPAASLSGTPTASTA